MQQKIPVVAVVGPTATGKTALGIYLAKIFGGEIVSCDSMQIYKGLAVGTAKPTEEEQTAAKHHLIGFLEVSQSFSVSDYVNLASVIVRDIHSRKRLPILVGGTGLYVRSLLKNLTFNEESPNLDLRNCLQRELEEQGEEVFYSRLAEVDPSAAEKIHPHNHKRVIRALEFCLTTGKLFSQQLVDSQAQSSPYRYKMLCLSFRDRNLLYKRIEQRVDRMLSSGLLTEARWLYDQMEVGKPVATAAQAIGYKEFFPYFRGEISLDEATRQVKQESRRYAKRQLTWFKREEELTTIYIDDFSDMQGVFNVAVQKTEELLRN